MGKFINKTITGIKNFGLKALAFLPAKYRLPSVYYKIKNLLYDGQYWDIDKIKNWQLINLKKIIRFAYDTVPGYNQLFNEQNITPDDIINIDDIKHLPFSTKELIRDNLKDFTSKAIPKWKMKYLTTGGSTGIPFGFYNTYNQYFIELAFIHFGWEKTGWKWAELSAVLRGAFVGNEQKFWTYDKFHNELHLSSYYLTKNTIPLYIKKIEEFKPKYIQAYPSSMIVFADYIKELYGENPLNFDVLFLGSENLYDWQKKILKEIFPASRIYSWYGHAEKVILAMNCKNSDKYHINPFYGLVKILDNDKNEVTENQSGELVGTSFWNFATPFIRYRTMDIATRGKNFCEHCQTNFELINSIEGRLQEFILTDDGRYISMTAINMHDDIFDLIKQFMFYQEQRGIVVFKYIPKRVLTQDEINEIEKRLKIKLKDSIHLIMQEVNDLPKMPSGKYRFLEQKLNLKYGE